MAGPPLIKAEAGDAIKRIVPRRDASEEPLDQRPFLIGA